MRTAGIICEYNPFHRGHAAMIDFLRRQGADAVVCAMSGNFVQRGEPAVAGKLARAEMALRGGADLVLELPSPWSCAAAETFAAGGVALLRATGVVTELAFGSESGDLPALREIARVLDTKAYVQALQAIPDDGAPLAVRRQAAVSQLLGETCGALLTQPNDILAVAYLRALRGSGLNAVAVPRIGAAHGGTVTDGIASSTHIRGLLRRGETEEALSLLPSAAAQILRREMAQGRAPADSALCERAVMDRLRRMEEEDFARYDGGREGLCHRLYRAVRESGTPAEVLENAKTKRYSTAHLRRMLLRAWLDLPARPPAQMPYLRLLAANEKGRLLLRQMAGVPVLTKAADVDRLGPEARALFEEEARRSDLYALAWPRPARCGEDWRITPIL